MIDRIDARDGVEAKILERQWSGGVTRSEIGATLVPQFLRARLRTGDSFGVQIETGDATSCLLCDPQGRSAGPACQVKQVARWRQLQPPRQALGRPPPSAIRRDQCPARSFHCGSRTSEFGAKPWSFSVSMLPIASPLTRSTTVIEPSFIPGRFSSEFCTKASLPSLV